MRKELVVSFPFSNLADVITVVHTFADTLQVKKQLNIYLQCDQRGFIINGVSSSRLIPFKEVANE
jgi:hypothetical protein